MQNLLNDLKAVLVKDERFTVEGKLLKNKVIEAGLQVDPGLIKLLLQNDQIKSHFFQEVEGILVFDKVKFQQFIGNKEFLPDSYTAFKNKIGLTSDGEFLAESKEVVLSWAYKDCILEGGQDKEDAKRDEIFWNETLAPGDIDRLLYPKVLTNWKRYNQDGEQRAKDLSLDDNLILKGNNLLTLHSLKKIYRGNIKIIYIDPPYNKNGDSFKYNDTFNHSTWLTFMKNRLSVAKELLASEGLIFLSIDDVEVHYLKVLCDEIFGAENFISTVVTQNNPKGRVMDKNFATSHEYLLVYSKGKLNQELSVGKSEEQITKEYPLKDGDGYYRELELRNTHRQYGRHNRKNLWFPLYVNPETRQVSTESNKEFSVKIEPIWDEGFEGCWTWNLKKCTLQIDLLTGRFVKERWKVFRKAYSTDTDGNSVSKKLRTIWLHKDFHTEKGQKSVDEIIGKGIFYAPKPVEYIKTIIDLSTNSEENDIVLDFFAGSGTTAQAVIELNSEDGGNRRFILCEQLDYVETVTRKRVAEIIKNQKGSFVYAELTKANQTWIDEVMQAETSEALNTLWDKMQQYAFISYKIEPKAISETASDFESLEIEEKKRFLVEILDKNSLYVNLSDIENKDFNVSDEDKTLTKLFYSLK